MNRRQFFKSLCLAPVMLLIPAQIDNDEIHHSDNQFDGKQPTNSWHRYVKSMDVTVDGGNQKRYIVDKPSLIDTSKHYLEYKINNMIYLIESMERFWRNV